VLSDAEFEAKPSVLLIGQYSVGKTTFIRQLIGQDFPGQRIGPEPTTDRFVAISHAASPKVVPGNACVVQVLALCSDVWLHAASGHRVRARTASVHGAAFIVGLGVLAAQHALPLPVSLRRGVPEQVRGQPVPRQVSGVRHTDRHSRGACGREAHRGARLPLRKGAWMPEWADGGGRGGRGDASISGDAACVSSRFSRRLAMPCSHRARGGCAQVIEWFAYRCDLILLIFDANKTDIGDEMRELMAALKGTMP
jgi:hypothetical protein